MLEREFHDYSFGVEQEQTGIREKSAWGRNQYWEPSPPTHASSLSSLPSVIIRPLPEQIFFLTEANAGNKGSCSGIRALRVIRVKDGSPPMNLPDIVIISVY